MKSCKYVVAVAGLCLAALMSGCTGTSRSRDYNVWATYDISLYGIDGKPIGHWTSQGKVYSETSSDGWFFTDSKTGKLMCVSGFVIIKQQ